MRSAFKEKSKSREDLVPFDLKECVLDSPVFRIQLQNHENVLNSTAKKLKSIQKSIKGVIKAHQELNSSMTALSSSMRGFHYVQLGEMAEEEEVISRSMLAYSETLEENERLRCELVVSLSHHLRGIDNALKANTLTLAEKKRKYEKEQSKTDKMAEAFVRSTIQSDEIVRSMRCQRNLLHVATLDYVVAINSAHTYNRLSLFEIMFQIFGHFRVFHEATRETIGQQEDFIKTVQGSLLKATDNIAGSNQQALLDEAIKAPYDIGDARLFRGYLLADEKKPSKKKLQFAGAIKRYFCSYDKSSCTLSRQDMADNSIEHVLVGCCRPNPANIFSFDLYSDISTEFSTYVALTEAEFENWCQILGIARDSKAADSVSQHSVEFVQECVSLLERNSGLSFMGIHRIEGSQERKAFLLELGSNPDSFDRFLKLVESNTISQPDMSSCLKGYLRSHKLISRNDMDSLKLVVESSKEESMCIDLFSLILSRMPEMQRMMLESVFEHLLRVADNSEVNMMTLDNLALCFAPLFSELDVTSIHQLSDMSSTFDVIKMCIRHSHQIFATISQDRIDQLEDQLACFLSR